MTTDHAPTNGHSLTGLEAPDDAHYRMLAIDPLLCVEAWSTTWPAGLQYHLGEAVQMIARAGTKGQTVRDLEKAEWLIGRALELLRP